MLRSDDVVTGAEHLLHELADFNPADPTEEIILDQCVETAVRGLQQGPDISDDAAQCLKDIARRHPAQAKRVDLILAAAALRAFPDRQDTFIASDAGNPSDEHDLTGFQKDFEYVPVPGDIDATPAESAPENFPEAGEDEGAPLQQAIHPASTCRWTSGLADTFRFCGNMVATMEERAQVRWELGYGHMPKDRSSLTKIQPYCAGHLRLSIAPAKKRPIFS